MKKIICNFSLFDMEQTIYAYIEEDGVQRYDPIGRCQLENLGKMLTEVCFANNIDNIHLYGHEKYIDGILHDIDMYSGCSAYSNGMIHVEVN